MAKWYDNDDFLLRRLASDDKEALAYLFRQNNAALKKTSRRIVGHAEQAEDIVQELFADLWEKRYSLKISKPVEAYLHKAVINRSLNFIRDHPERTIVSLESIREVQYATAANDAGGKLEAEEMIRILSENIKKMPPQRKVVFKLSRDEEMSYREIAETLGISVKAVEKHISKALKNVRESLGPYLKSLLLFCW